ncbi:hypothetical protein SAMN05444397_101664 [Flavobacterium aquidurense]|uniref:Lipoprotein n=1 Tax=Flavobacterium frigidimaris TaxID=262320 RepID=A0ABX4BKA3_FLAFR|nr:fimbrillin family protein [Flavobacterium frigidimaris]OXA75530.1 hypothetical protein B0A65_21475 [Flavobacterium frigidimaris]SDY44576.1 hypothetical protein SAMN05444397_101664 [Flavobacterium aquidurense]
MKSFKIKSVLVVLFLSTVLFSCSNDDEKVVDNGTTKSAFASEVKGPVTGKINEELSYEVTFTADNACGVFNKFSEVTIGAEKGLQVEVKYPSQVCTLQVPTPQKEVYKFKSAVKGTFDIKFKKSETEFITQKVVIE